MQSPNEPGAAGAPLKQAETCRCILFLDFDGVTHPDPCEVDQLFTKLPLIEDVLREFQACSIVVSSSWREVHPLVEMRAYFSKDIQSRVIGVTPKFPVPHRHVATELTPAHHRQWECEKWLQSKQVWLPQNRRIETPWIAIDDRHEWFHSQCPNLLATTTRIGFTPTDAYRLYVMLKERLP